MASKDVAELELCVPQQGYYALVPPGGTDTHSVSSLGMSLMLYEQKGVAYGTQAASLSDMTHHPHHTTRQCHLVTHIGSVCSRYLFELKSGSFFSPHSVLASWSPPKTPTGGLVPKASSIRPHHSARPEKK